MRTKVAPNSIGRTEHLVTFENPGPAIPDGEGGYTESWTPVTIWFVRIRPATPKDAEAAVAGTVITHLSHVVHGRFHSQISTKSRMVFNGRTYQITSVSPIDGRDFEMELIADLQE